MSKRYGAPTVPVRLSVKFAGEVEAFVNKARRKLPLFLVGKPPKAQ